LVRPQAGEATKKRRRRRGSGRGGEGQPDVGEAS
jgi:hypothetical protein